jgi:hypothetical protein
MIHYHVTERNLLIKQTTNYYEPSLDAVRETVKFAATMQPGRRIVNADIYQGGAHYHYSVGDADNLLFTWDVVPEDI